MGIDKFFSEVFMKMSESIARKVLCLFAVGLVAASMVFAGGGSQSGGAVTELRGLLRAGQGNLNDLEANPTLAFVNQATGIKLIVDQLPVDNTTDKLNAVMASGGGGYDFIAVSSLERYAAFATQGALLDMGAIWKDYPNLQSTPQSLIDLVTIGNTFYCVPGLSPSGPDNSGSAGPSLMWRVDTLKTMGRNMPTTLDEFTALLQAYKDQDPLKNGAANVPLVTDGNGLNSLRMNAIGGAFGIELDWIDQGGTLIAYQTQDGFFEYINYMHDLYARGLLDKEMPTNNNASINQKFTTNRALAVTRGWGDVIQLASAFKVTDAGTLMDVSQPLERNGKAGMSASAKNLQDFVTVIPKSSKNWQTTMAYLDKKMDPVIFKEMAIGKEGIDYKTEPSGLIVPILPAFGDHRNTANQYLTGTRPEYNKYWLEARVGKDTNQYNAYQRANVDYARFIHVNVVSALQCEYYKDINAPLTNSGNMTGEFLINSVVNGITRAEFNTFVTQWKAQSGDVLSKLYNEWYKTYKK
jgi:putative aldouronate transport system substrate-binding protein